jgi:hypothetical protein
MSMYGFHTAIKLLRDVRAKIARDYQTNSHERDFQLRNIDKLIECIQDNYHVALQKELRVKSADELEHEAEQMCSRLEVAFGCEGRGGKWN